MPPKINKYKGILTLFLYILIVWGCFSCIVLVGFCAGYKINEYFVVETFVPQKDNGYECTNTHSAGELK